jgi:hypothetical protein
MFIQIDWYRETGKWAYGGEIEIGDGTFLWHNDFKQQIVNNQNIINDGWQDSDYYHVVVSDTHADSLSPNYRGFFKHYFPPGSFNGIRQQAKNFISEKERGLHI